MGKVFKCKWFIAARATIYWLPSKAIWCIRTFSLYHAAPSPPRHFSKCTCHRLLRTDDEYLPPFCWRLPPKSMAAENRRDAYWGAAKSCISFHRAWLLYIGFLAEELSSLMLPHRAKTGLLKLIIMMMPLDAIDRINWYFEISAVAIGASDSLPLGSFANGESGYCLSSETRTPTFPQMHIYGNIYIAESHCRWWRGFMPWFICHIHIICELPPHTMPTSLLVNSLFNYIESLFLADWFLW